MKRAVTLAAYSAPELLEDFTRSGAQASFEEVVRRYAGMVYHTCYRVTKSQHDAEDAAQAAFLSLAVQCRSGKPIKAVGPWLQRVAHRLALDIRRSQKRREVRETKHNELQRHAGNINGDGSVHNGNGHAGWDQQELQRVMNEALQTLPTKYRMPMILHYFGGLSREQIASELRCKTSTLGVRIHRGREMLREKLSGRGVVLSLDAVSLLLTHVVGNQVTESLIASTASAAGSFAGGIAVDAHLISSQVLALAGRTARAVAVARLKVAVAALLVALPVLSAAGPVMGQIARIPWLELSPVKLIQRLVAPVLQESLPMPQATDDTPPPPVQVAPQRPNALPDLSDFSPVPHRPRVLTAPPPAGAPTIELTSLPVTTARPQFTGLPAATRGGMETSYGTVASQVGRSTIAPTPPPVEHSAGAEAESSFQPVLLASSGGEGESPSPRIFAGSAVPIKEPVAHAPQNLVEALGIANTSRASLAGPTMGSNFTIAQMPIDPTNDGASSTTAVLVYTTSGATNDIFRGWGTASSAGVVQQAGRVFADGFGINRVLDLSHIKLDLSSENSPFGGTLGWYAVKTGALLLPSMTVGTGNSTITFGESQTDPTLDLINSARLSLHDVTHPGTASIELLAMDNTSVPTLPLGHHFIGIWNYSTTSQQTGPTDLIVRYDSEMAFVMGLPESILKLWVYNDHIGWTRITDSSFGRDTVNNLIRGSYSGDFSYFAVSAPEPSGLLVLASGAFLMMRRNRRKNSSNA